MTYDAGDIATQTETYVTGVQRVRELARLRTEHVAAGCNAGPLCPGRDAQDVIQAAVDSDRRAGTTLLLAAIGEVGRLTTENGELARQGLRLHADLLDAYGRLSDWEEAASILGPIGEVRGG